MEKQTVAVDIAEVKALAGYLADLDDDGGMGACHELDGALTVLERLGLDRIARDAWIALDEDED